MPGCEMLGGGGLVGSKGCIASTGTRCGPKRGFFFMAALEWTDEFVGRQPKVQPGATANRLWRQAPETEPPGNQAECGKRRSQSGRRPARK
ncbi:hypothetical protein RRF57_010988 [Xylaria bambusicola]|uniref:Uncharacterized protein n=1 Tax=Xylaria bambusicola TaxID=326684 RepID=A0AAN7UYV7_9PEZI